jgi:hypothetical protein
MAIGTWLNIDIAIATPRARRHGCIAALAREKERPGE